MAYWSQMKIVFENWTVESKPEPDVPKVMTFGFTEAEEMWTQNQFNQVQDQFVSVSPPARFILEALEIARGQSPTRLFLSSWISMTIERARRVLKMHPEFTNLEEQDQVTKLMAVVVAHLVERSLPMLEVRGSNPVISKINVEHLFIVNCVE